MFQSDGQDVLSSEGLCQHWSRYKEDYAALPTTTHYVERSVKISNFCRGSSQSRNEDRTSQFAICYNIVHNVNDTAKENMISTRHMKKGDEYKDQDKLEARGKTRQKTALHTVLRRHKEIERALKVSTLYEAYTYIKEQMQINGKSFQSERQNKEYEINVSKSIKPRKENRIERMSGFDITAAMANKVRFSAATKNFQDGIDLELSVRGVEDLSTNTFRNFKEKKDMLRKLCAQDEGVSINECTHFDIRSSYDWTKINATK